MSKTTWMNEKLPQLNIDHKVCDKCHKKISKLKCDASTKQKDDDSDSNEIEQFAKITAMQSSNESLQ
jgi:TPP-dependent indolepyruvate ferredoxin oxidoreductase alpha subunit